MERVFAAGALAAVVMLAGCGTVDAGPARLSVAGGVSPESVEAASSNTVPDIDQVEALLPPGTEVLALAHGDIDADGHSDVVVAVQHAVDKRAAEEGASGGRAADERGADGRAAGGRRAVDERAATSARRALLLLVRDAEAGLRIAAWNDRVVPCAMCGGSLGEPSIHLEAATGAFVLRTEGGTAWLWSNEYAFGHEGNRQWHLRSVTQVTHHRSSQDTTRSARTAADFGRVDFVDFDPDAAGNNGRGGE